MLFLCEFMNEDHYDFSFLKFWKKIFILIYLIENINKKKNRVF